MPNSINENRLNTIEIRDRILKLPCLIPEFKDDATPSLTPLTGIDIKKFQKLIDKMDRSASEEEEFNEVVEKISSILALYDQIVQESLKEGKYNRTEIKGLLQQRYWQSIVVAYKQAYGDDFDAFNREQKKLIASIRAEHINYVERAMFCLLEVNDFSLNHNFNKPTRLVNFARFDDRYFARHEVKKLLEKDQQYVPEILQFYISDYERSELKSKYSYVNHLYALFDYYQALPQVYTSPTEELVPFEPNGELPPSSPGVLVDVPQINVPQINGLEEHQPMHIERENELAQPGVNADSDLLLTNNSAGTNLGSTENSVDLVQTFELDR
ncbi:MAG: hypothetical protein ACOVQX_03420, partial [Legionella sp.]